MTTFIKTKSGKLLNVASITALRVDRPNVQAPSAGETLFAVFADDHELGWAAAGASANALCHDLATRVAARPGVYFLRDGKIEHRFLDDETGNFRTVIYAGSETGQ